MPRFELIMKILYIFALFLLFACCEETKHPVLCVCVEQFSDALPIQIWPEDCNTYNETDPEGVHYKCFCQPWKCTDEIPLQFTSDEEGTYELVLYDEDDEIIDSIPFVETALDGSPEIPGATNPITLPALSSGVNIPSAGDNWTLGSNPSISINGTGAKVSDVWSNLYPFIDGYDYEFTPNIDYDFGSSSVVNRIIFVVLDSGNNILFQFNSADLGIGASGTYATPISFTAIEGMVKYGFRITSTHITTTSDTADINSITATETSPTIPAVPTTQWLYSTSFIPSEHGICEQKIRTKIVKVSESPDESVGKSDCIDVSDANPDPTVLITYSNNRNFAGLVYEDVSPAPEFNIRVPAVFFHERFPEEDEAIELSDSRIINLNGVVRAQRLLDTAYMPYYMHRKLKLIFKHSNVTVEDLPVTKQDAYEIEEGDRRWPVKKAKCWLTEKDFVQRNVV